MNPFKTYSRRQVLKLAGTTVLFLQGCSHGSQTAENESSAAASDPLAEFLRENGPVNRSLGVDEPTSFSGDAFSRAHEALWDLAGFLKKNPPPAQAEADVPVIVIGGGLSGLTSAYLLRDLAPIVLEQAPRFGGNSQGQTWRGMPYTIGAAYFLEPDAGTPLAKLLTELNVLRDASRTDDSHVAIVDKRRTTDFFAGHPRFVQSMRKYLSSPNTYPTLPTTDPRERKWVNDFDTRNLQAQLEKDYGGKLPWDLDQWVEHYCWSSFGASAREISAAAGINFLASEFGDTRFFPQGNSGVTERLVERLHASIGPERLQTDALVLEVAKQKNGLWSVLFVDKAQKVRRLAASAVTMACPKFVASKIVAGLEPARLAAIGAVKYRAYCVANVLVDGKFDLGAYDAFVVDGTHRGLRTEEHAQRANATDVICATYKTNAKDSVLTLFRGLPYGAGRAELFSGDAWTRFKSAFDSQLREVLLPALGINAARIRGVRMARWGHSMPVPEVGVFRKNIVDKLHAPFQDTAFFVHQDNWLLPSLETSMEEALRWTPRIRAAVKKQMRS